MRKMMTHDLEQSRDVQRGHVTVTLSLQQAKTMANE